ncbi:MAG: DUF4386 domain-containing protein [Chloroflexota bacterium]
MEQHVHPQTCARLTGVLFLITFITAIPALILFGPVLHDPSYVTGDGADARIFFGAILELLLIVANIGTALALYPVMKYQNEGLALGYVAARIVECVFIAVGILAVLSVVTLRQHAGSLDTGTLLALSAALVAVKDWTFLLGPGFVVGIGNGLMLGYLMYRSNLMPRALSLLGLVGGPLVCASGIAVMFGVMAAGSVGQFVATIPEIAWELSLGIYLSIRGFRPAPLLATGHWRGSGGQDA